MNENLWSSFYHRAINPVFPEGKSRIIIDLGSFSSEEYPALKILTTNSLIEVFTLSLIISYTGLKYAGVETTMDIIIETFEFLDAKEEEIKSAVYSLLDKQWIMEIKSEEVPDFTYEANFPKLREDKLFEGPEPTNLPPA